MQLKSGMRVRCVNNGSLQYMMQIGDEFTVSEIPEQEHNCVYLQGYQNMLFCAERFRPVVRVKAPLVYTGKAFDNLVARAVEMFGRLPPDIQAAHRDEQRRSWVRGELALRKMGHG